MKLRTGKKPHPADCLYITLKCTILAHYEKVVSVSVLVRSFPLRTIATLRFFSKIFFSEFHFILISQGFLIKSSA